MKNNVTSRSMQQAINGIAYDRTRLTQGMRSTTLFNLVQGEGVTSDVGMSGTKTLADTNMTEKGRVSIIKPMRINGFYLRLEAGKSDTTFVPAGFAGYTQEGSEATFTGADDIAAMLASINVVMQVGTDKEYVVGNVANFPPTNGLTTSFGGGGAYANAQQAGQVYEFVEEINWTNELPINIILTMGDGLVLPSGNIGRITGCFTGTYYKDVQ